MAQNLHDLGQQTQSGLIHSSFDDTVQNSSGLLFTVPTTAGSGQEDTSSCCHVAAPLGTLSNQKSILELTNLLVSGEDKAHPADTAIFLGLGGVVSCLSCRLCCGFSQLQGHVIVLGLPFLLFSFASCLLF